MDRNQQATRIQKLVDTIAHRTIGLSTDKRSTFIKSEVEKVRADFQRTYEADEGLMMSAMALVDGMYGLIKARVKTLETEGSRLSRGDDRQSKRDAQSS